MLSLLYASYSNSRSVESLVLSSFQKKSLKTLTFEQVSTWKHCILHSRSGKSEESSLLVPGLKIDNDFSFQIIHHSVYDKLPRGGGPLLVLVHLLQL